MKISTNWLKDFVTLEPPLERLAERLTMAGLEVKKIDPRPDLKDTIFEVEVTTNRPDWLSHLGIAREIHAVENTGLKLPPAKNPEHRPMPPGWRIDLKELEACPYYTACLLEGIQLVPTPDWMKNRLTACGLRPINLIVDITNYVLLEVGQPLHAFDSDLLQGKEVEVRRAKPQEMLKAIDGKNYTLQASDLVIADKERAVALAGVMGGQETEVGERTRNILLEAAFFHPRWVRKTAVRLGLSSESSYRFERRVDSEGVDLGRERAVYLFRELAGVRNVSAVLKAGRKPTLAKSRLHLSLDQVKKILGMELKPHEVHSLLTRLGLEPKKEGAQTWGVSVPSYRADLEGPADLVEELARLHGYEKIPGLLPERPPVEIPSHPLRELEEKTRNFLAGCGLFETVTFSLVNRVPFEAQGWDPAGMVEIHNPMHEELTLLRPSFLMSLLEVQARNERAGARSVALFEIASLYSRAKSEEPPREEKSLGLLLAGEHKAGWNDPKRAMNFFDLKGVLEEFFEFLALPDLNFSPCDLPWAEAATAAQVKSKTEILGRMGAVSMGLREGPGLRSPAFFAELSLEKLVRLLPRVRRFSGFSRYPVVERDLSLVVEESVKAAEILHLIESLGKGLVQHTELFDLFRGGRIPKGQKNFAFRLTYQSPERTLTSDEVQRLHTRIAEELAKKFQAAFQGK